MLYYWGRSLHLNYEQSKISDIEIMNAWFSSSGSFYQFIGQNILAITLIQVEGITSIRTQRLYIEQIINHSWFFNTLEDTSVAYHRKFVK